MCESEKPWKFGFSFFKLAVVFCEKFDFEISLLLLLNITTPALLRQKWVITLLCYKVIEIH